MHLTWIRLTESAFERLVTAIIERMDDAAFVGVIRALAALGSIIGLLVAILFLLK